MNGINGSDHHQVPVISVVDEPTNAPDETSNFAKCLLYKKVSNGKYVRFETVVKNGLYDTATGKIKGTFFLLLFLLFLHVLSYLFLDIYVSIFARLLCDFFSYNTIGRKTNDEFIL